MIYHFCWERRKWGLKRLFLPEITHVVSVESRSSDFKSLDLNWPWPGLALGDRKLNSSPCSVPSLLGDLGLVNVLGVSLALLPWRLWIAFFSILFQQAGECITKVVCSIWQYSLSSLHLSSPCLISFLCHFNCVICYAALSCQSFDISSYFLRWSCFFLCLFTVCLPL